MTDITLEQLAAFMEKQLPATFDVFEKNRSLNAEHNAAWWARGRIDAYFQILEVLDKDRLDRLRTQWEQIVDGDNAQAADE